MSEIQTLEIEAVVKKEADFLIDRVNRLEDMLKDIISHMKNSDKDSVFGKSQIRNLLSAAQNALSVNEMILFIQYQIGRDDKSKSWNKKIKNFTLGESVIQILREIDARAKEIAPPSMYDQVVNRMMTQFFLYWSWKYTFISTLSKNTQNKSPNNNKR